MDKVYIERKESGAVAHSKKINQLARQLKLFIQLQGGVGCTAEQLAKEFEVSRRTIFRDLSSLEKAGVEIRLDDAGSSYRIMPHFGLRLPPLSTDEVVSVVLAAYLSPLYANEKFWPHIHQALGKLLDKLPADKRNGLLRLVDSLDVDRGNARPAGATDEMVHHLTEAIRCQHDVRLTYYQQEPVQLVQTKVTPQRLAISPSGWLLKGRSTWHRATYEFNLDHVLRVEPHRELFSFKIADKLSLAAESHGD